MKIKSICVKNFRGYKNDSKIDFDNLTLIVGKNDIGKSTILEAGDIFFGNRKLDNGDLNILCKDDEKVEIAIEFKDYPVEIDLDAGAKTNLKDEHLLNKDGFLEIRKIFTINKTSSSAKIYITSNTYSECIDLLNLKNKDLKELAEKLGIDKSQYKASVNNEIRKAIREHYKDEEPQEFRLEINKEDGKEIYDKLELEFPIYTLFSVDRKNDDQDDEIQSPIKATIKKLVAEFNDKLEPIKQEFLKEIDKMTDKTIEKIKEMNPEVASSLKSTSERPAWEKAFSIKIESDGIPLNKRGSGVKRLVLINFFRAEAERSKEEKSKNNIFFAIEEPEASQHPDWQIKLFNAFKELSEAGNYQIALTSHHPELCGLVDLNNIRFIKKENDKVEILNADDSNYKEIGKTLGILPDFDGIRVCICLEGPNDITFLKNISNIFGLNSEDDKILWLPLGGGTIKHYVTKGYLKNLKNPQIHFYDKDEDNKYVDCVSELCEKGHWAKLTNFLTIENYFHPCLYKQIFSNLQGDFVDFSNNNWLSNWAERNIPNELSEFIKDENDRGGMVKKLNSGNVKKRISANAGLMSKTYFEEMGTFEEINNFFNEIKKNL